MLGSPLFQILFFTYLGRYAAGSEDDEFFIVGNAIQVAAMAGIYGMTMGIANERQYGTLQPLLLDAGEPARDLRQARAAVRPQRAPRLRVRLRGLVAPARLPPAGDSVPAHAGRGAGDDVLLCRWHAGQLHIGLRPRPSSPSANLVYFLMLLVCGVNVPVDELPGWLEAVGNCLPLTHGIERARSQPARAWTTSAGCS